MEWGLSERAKLFVERISDGTIPKRHLVNYGFDYTKGPEGIACARFNSYISSCGYQLMRHRIETEARGYRG